MKSISRTTRDVDTPKRRQKKLPEKLASPNENGLSTTIAQSLAAFRRHLPSLLKDHKGEWVAYSMNQCLGFGTSKTQLYQECFRRGLKRGDFIVESVEPDMSREIDLFLDLEM